MKNKILPLLCFWTIALGGYAQSTSDDGTFTALNGSDISLQTSAPGGSPSFTRVSVLSSNGFMGVGITTPGDMLHVNGSIRGNQFNCLNGIFNVLSSTNNFSLNLDNTNRLTIVNSNGFVGIGTTSPSEMLHINGNILTNKITTTNGLINATASSFALQTNGTNRLTVLDASGNVGIGTSTPQSKLHVTGGNLTLDNGSTPTIFTGTGASELGNYLQVSNSSSQPTPSGLKAGGVLIADTYAYANPGKNNLIVKGKVGIGTSLSTNPNNYTLAVNGTIGAKDMRVEKTSSTWPDYVFETNYDLPSLGEIATYVSKNKHLPDVPSAEEVEKNGHSLGDMDAILLKKVEELTLYIFEQQKQIDALKKQLEHK